MSAIHWTTAVSADFGNAADWSIGAKPGRVPGPGDDAILDASGTTAYTVTASTSETVSSIQTAATATLAISGGTFTASSGTGSGGNAGTILVGDATSFNFGGLMNNSGLIEENSGGDTTEVVLTANTTLSGAGQVTLSDNVGNYLLSAAPTTVLVNVDNTISGAGNIGNGQMVLTNQKAGVINAVGANALVINLGGRALTNAGLMEGTGAGGLTINGAVVDNTAGAIEANVKSGVAIENSTVKNAGGGGITIANGAVGTLQAADVVGGALNVVGTGAFRAVGGASLLDGTKGAITLNGPLSINDAAALGLAGSIVNSGRISLDSGGDTTILSVNANTTLSGGGQLVIGDNTGNYLQGTAATIKLVNVDNTISGAGNLGNGQLVLTNQAAGIINATGANALLVNVGASTLVNGGLIESSGAGGLNLQNATIANASGTLQANTGSVVTLSSTDVIGGTLVANGTGAFQATGTSEFDGRASTVNLTGSVRLSDANNLQLAGAVANGGTISVNGAGDVTVMTLAFNTTLSGAGTVILSDNINNYVQGAAASVSLVNVNNTISGAGHIGNGQMILTNQAAGIINAVGANGLTINTGVNALTNLGLIEATGAGGLAIQNTTVNNVGGTIRANAGATVTLSNADIVGGTLGVQGAGGFVTLASAELDGTTSVVSLAGPLRVNDANQLSLAGSIANSGVITLASGGDTTELVLAANTTLGGGGRIILSDNTNNYIFGSSSTFSLNNVDNTISGSGHLGNGQLVLLNQASGTINANGGGGLIIDTGASTVTNVGLIESTGSGGLRINSPINNSGTLLAHTATLSVAGPLANITGATLTGGTYEADAGATLELPQNTSIVTDKAIVILNGVGSTIEAFNTTSSAEVAIDATLATVAASGALEILGGRNWSTKAAMSNAGSLQLGGGTFAATSLNNSGTATGFGSITAPLTNSGVLSVQANTTLNLGTLTNLSGTTLTGGTYIAGAGASLELAKNLSIATLNATIDLAGVGANMQSLNTTNSSQVTIDSTLATIGASGVLEVLGGRNFTSANAIANGGSLQLGGGVFASGTLTDSTGSSLSGFGALASVFSDAGTVTASGGALAFTGVGDTFAGAIGGTEVDFAGGGDALNSGTSLTVSTLGVSGGATVTLGLSLAFSGVLVDGAGTTLSIGANSLTLTGSGSTIAGTLSGAVGGVLTFGGGSQTLNTGVGIGAKAWSLSGGDATTLATSLTYAGGFSEAADSSLSVAAGDTLGLTGAITLAGTVTGGGTLSQSGGSEALNAGAELGVVAWALKKGAAVTIDEDLTFAGALSEDATSSITIGAGDTLTAGGAVSFAGTLGGAGALVLSDGASATFGAAISLGGAFVADAATATVSSGDTLALTGVSTFGPGAVVNGAGTLTLANATFGGLTIGGTLTVSDLGSVDQVGSITLGDATSGAAKLTIGKGDIYELNGDVGISRGKSTKSLMTVSGTLIKNAGNGISIVGVKVTDSGLVEAATGTLDFTQALAGKGVLKIDAGATLQTGTSAASTLTVMFNGSGATLAISKSANFAATIAGFTTGETIDLLKTAATGASVNGSDQLVIVDGAKTIATLQLTGNYAGFVFDVGSDGQNGSAITLAQSPGAAQPAPAFVQAMASMGANAATTSWREPIEAAARMPGLSTALVGGHRPVIA